LKIIVAGINIIQSVPRRGCTIGFTPRMCVCARVCVCVDECVGARACVCVLKSADSLARMYTRCESNRATSTRCIL